VIRREPKWQTADQSDGHSRRVASSQNGVRLEIKLTSIDDLPSDMAERLSSDAGRCHAVALSERLSWVDSHEPGRGTGPHEHPVGAEHIATDVLALNDADESSNAVDRQFVDELRTWPVASTDNECTITLTAPCEGRPTDIDQLTPWGRS
jgi:hypothetical protein